MYTLARLLMILSVFAACYALVVLGYLLFPWSLLILLGWMYSASKKEPQLTDLGRSRFADMLDLRGMLNTAIGLDIGKLQVTESSWAWLGYLFNFRISSKDALRLMRKRGDYSVKLARACHICCFAPTGAGKSLFLIIRWLLTCLDSAVVIDFKGELYRLTAEARRQAGHLVVCIDPYRQVTDKPDTLNPFDTIRPNDKNAIDYCNSIGNSLVTMTGKEMQPHFPESARMWVSAICALIVMHAVLGDRSLQTVQDCFAGPEALKHAIDSMRKAGGMLARMAGYLLHYTGDELASVLSTVARNLQFLNSAAIAESTSSSSFNPAELTRKKITVYFVLPPNFIGPNMGLLRLWISTCFRAIIAGGMQEKNLVHFILDEASALGHMTQIEEALAMFRAFGIRLQMYWQSPAQLKKCFPDGADVTVLSNTTQVYFGTQDIEIATHISKVCGQHTINVKSGGSSHQRSHQENYPTADRSYTTSTGTNDAWQPTARELLKPEEVLALPPDTAITLTPGVGRPIMTKLIPYFAEKEDKPLLRPRKLVAALLLAMLCIAIPVGMSSIKGSSRGFQFDSQGERQFENEEEKQGWQKLSEREKIDFFKEALQRNGH